MEVVIIPIIESITLILELIVSWGKRYFDFEYQPRLSLAEPLDILRK